MLFIINLNKNKPQLQIKMRFHNASSRLHVLTPKPPLCYRKEGA
jgi:hypothetical protein